MALRGSSKRTGKKGKKGRDEAVGEPMNTRLYLRDIKEFGSVAKQEFRGNDALAIRELVSEALTTRRLREAGRDTRLGEVKAAQKEVVSGELSEVKALLGQVLSIIRGQGSRSDQILLEIMAAAGVLRPLLASVLHIEEISEEHILKPVLKAANQDEDEQAATVKDAEGHWREQARIIFERVKMSVNINDV